MGVEMRAKKTAPKGILEVQTSKIHGLGVFALRSIQKGVRLGPYQGQITRIDSTKGYAWKLKGGRLVDASDEKISNYLRYVNCARNVYEQNVIAFQYQGQLYYRTSKMISKGEELLVYYGPTYARELGIDPKKYFEPPEEKSQPVFFTCQYCYIGLSTDYYRSSHELRCQFHPKRSIVYDDSFVCQYCKYNLSTKEVLDAHEKYCRQKKQINCAGEEDKTTLCDKIDFKKKQERTKTNAVSMKNNKENVELETTPKKNKNRLKYLCSICKKYFSERRSLDNHYLCVHPDGTVEILSKIHSCQFCSYKTTFPSDLNRHNCKGDDRPKYGCSHCKYVTKHKSDLVKHLRLHVGQKPFACSECNKQFNQKIQLDNHILTKHNDNQLLIKSITAKIWSCSVCNYRTTIKTPYDSHLLTHSQETPHVCSECKKGFKEKSQLQGHILSRHSNNESLMKMVTYKIHTCEICQKYRTINKNQFKKHLETHLK
uniref:Zinc finger Y-chromosomal protein-like n=1 Tax=Diabrotica virgifera virgifera TaxID=50390 RepID=A0A6P7FMZ7_DIAVI